MSASEKRHPPVVTIAALYGAAGSVIGPRVAEQLGVPLLDREVPEAVAKKTGIPNAAVADVDEEPRSGIDRLAARLGRASTMSGAVGGLVERLDLQERDIRSHIEEFLARASVSGGVAIGCGGMVVLRSVPWALHVHLGGPPEARVQYRMALDGIDHRTAERRRAISDRSLMEYVRRAYGVPRTSSSSEATSTAGSPSARTPARVWIDRRSSALRFQRRRSSSSGTRRWTSRRLTREVVPRKRSRPATTTATPCVRRAPTTCSRRSSRSCLRAEARPRRAS
jgi:hypothetical protein